MKTKDGWHQIAKYDVYVESGKVVYGVISEGTDMKTLCPYRLDSTYGGWYNEPRMITLDGLRAGLRRGTELMR